MKRVDTEFYEKGPFLSPFLILLKLRWKKRDASSNILESFLFDLILTSRRTINP